MEALLGTFIKQGYLEKQPNGLGAANKNRATQEDVGEGGDPTLEWRWGPRADVEMGELNMAKFIENFYAEPEGTEREVIKTKSALLHKKCVRLLLARFDTDPGSVWKGLLVRLYNQLKRLLDPCTFVFRVSVQCITHGSINHNSKNSGLRLILHSLASRPPNCTTVPTPCKIVMCASPISCMAKLTDAKAVALGMHTLMNSSL